MKSDASVAPSGGRHFRQHRATLKFFYGPMDCGKSTLALQMNHNHARQGRRGLLLTKLDRSGRPHITSRIGLGSDAVELFDDMDVCALVARWSKGKRLDYLICDEAQFYTLDQIEALADVVDHCDVDVYAFGLATDFRSELFPASRRLLELADCVSRLQVEVLCWCGREGSFNARVVGDVVIREGAQVIIGDTSGEAVRYQVMCRRHYRTGDLGPVVPGLEQLAVS
ncbi:MAG: thymidine kinase [Longispora sp.]|nr:thymidine kinase [Longispora sp. (in: high G+C Gram-positive bacteria)]